MAPKNSTIAIAIVLDDGYRLIVNLRLINHSDFADGFYCFRSAAFPDALKSNSATVSHVGARGYCYTAVTLHPPPPAAAQVCAPSLGACRTRQERDQQAGDAVTACRSGADRNNDRPGTVRGAWARLSAWFRR
ncbi:hypothetical protein [Haliangium sp.]|uniref:hypothetical protein n=1 Tax=Haliangium sp. TaxID=2663208 RepID=UPI003D12F7BC